MTAIRQSPQLWILVLVHNMPRNEGYLYTSIKTLPSFHEANTIPYSYLHEITVALTGAYRARTTKAHVRTDRIFHREQVVSFTSLSNSSKRAGRTPRSRQNFRHLSAGRLLVFFFSSCFIAPNKRFEELAEGPPLRCSPHPRRGGQPQLSRTLCAICTRAPRRPRCSRSSRSTS